MYIPDRRAEGVRPDEDAGGDVPEDQGQPEPSGHDASKEGGHQDERYVAGDPQILVFTLPSSKIKAARPMPQGKETLRVGARRTTARNLWVMPLQEGPISR